MHAKNTQQQRKVLIADSDTRSSEQLRHYFTLHGINAFVVSSPMDMAKAMEREYFDLIVLDLMLEAESGLEICRKLRALDNDTPIIMISAQANYITRIIGLEMGADDYLAKPFNARELLARINAILRRRIAPSHPAAPAQDNSIIKFGPYAFNLGTRSLYRNKNPIDITSGEFAVLKAFVNNPNIPLSRDKLMELARGRRYTAFDRSLDVQVARVRKLIEPDPGKPVYIQTIWGLGYVFIPDSNEDT